MQCFVVYAGNEPGLSSISSILAVFDNEAAALAFQQSEERKRNTWDWVDVAPFELLSEPADLA